MAGANTDQRIVQMQFDNRQFERNIAKSTKSIEELKQAMNFDETSKGMEKFASGLNGLNLSTMENNIQKLTDKFTGLGTASELVLSQIRRKIEEAASSVSRFVESMTTAQVSAGMAKYEEMNKSVQTIMAATGKTEKEVYSVLQRLNEYTDQTSYSFSDMASNIGKFTSVGIPLEKAEKQMEGIANWAARSGAGINEASRAMYNLSQAMGVGSLKLVDWKSIENAGMATKEFKQQMIEAGIAAGTLEVSYDKSGNRIVKTAKSLGKQVEVNYTNLSQTLNKQWATTEVIGDTLEKYYYEDLYWSGKIAATIETEKDQRDQLRELYKSEEELLNTRGKVTKTQSPIAGSGKELKEEAEALADASTALTYAKWQEFGLDESEATLNKAIDLAVKQKKLLKEVNEEGYTTFKVLGKNGKQTEVTIESIQDLLSKVGVDYSLASSLFGLEDDALLEATESQLEGIRKALGDDDVLLKKDWAENMTALGLNTDEVKQSALDAAVSIGTLEKTVDKDGKTIYKTSKKLGKQMVVTMDTFDDSLKMKWFTNDVADKIWGLNDLSKASYAAAQKCKTFSDVLGAWKDQISTGWMNSFKLIFGELSDSMEFFSNVCNRVGDAIGELIELRNNILGEWVVAGGRDTLIDIILGDYGKETATGAFGLLDILEHTKDLVGNAMLEFLLLFANPTDSAIIRESLANGDTDDFVAWMGLKLAGMLKSVEDFMQGIRDFFGESVDIGGESKTRFQLIQEAILGIAAVLRIGYDVIKGLASFVSIIWGQIQPSVDAILGFLSKLGLGLYDVSYEVGQSGTIVTFFQELAVILKPVTDAINDIVVSTMDFLSALLNLDDETGASKTFFETLGSVAKWVAGIFTDYLSPTLNFIGNLITVFKDLVTGGFGAENLLASGEKVKNAFNEFLANLPEPVQKIIDFFKTAGNNIKSAVMLVFNKDTAEAAKEKFSGIFGKVLDLLPDDLQDKFGRVLERISSLFKDIWTKITSAIFGKDAGDAAESLTETVGDKIKEATGIGDKIKGMLGLGSGLAPFATLKEQIKGLFTPSEEDKKITVFDALRNWFSSLNTDFTAVIQDFMNEFSGEGDTFGKLIVNILKGIGQVILEVVKFFSTLDGSKLLSFAAEAVAAFVLIKSLNKLAKGISSVGKALNDGVKIKVGPEKAKSKANEFMKYAIAIALMCAAVTVIGKMKVEDALLGIGVITVLMTAVAIMSKAMLKIFKGSKLTQSLGIFLTMMAIASAIKGLVNALKPLADLNTEQLAHMGYGLLSVMASLAFVSLLARGGAMSKKNLKGILLLAGAVSLIIFTLRSVMNLKPDEYTRMGLVLAALMTMLWAFSKAVSKSGTSMNNSGMKEMLALAGAIAVLVLTLKRVAGMEWEDLGKMGATLAGILVLLGLFSFAMSKTKTTLGGSYMGQLLSVAAAITLLIMALKPITEIDDWGDIGRMGAVLGGIMLTLGIFIGWFSKYVKSMKNMGLGQLVFLAAAIAILVKTFVPLGDMDDNKLIKMGTCLLYVLLVLGMFVKALDGLSIKAVGIASLLGIAAAIALLIVALSPLTLYDWENLGKMGAAMAVISTFLAILVHTTSKLNIASAIGGVLMVLSISTVLMALTAMLDHIKDMDVERIKWAMIGLAGILAAMSLFVFAVSRTDWKSGIAATLMLLSFGGILVAFGYMVDKIKGVDPEPIRKLMDGLAILMGVFAIGSWVAGKAGVLGVTLFVAGIIALVAGIIFIVGLLAPWVLDRIGTGLTSMVSNLTVVAGMLGNFSSGINSVDESATDKCERILEKIGDLIVYMGGIVFSTANVTNVMNAIGQLTIISRELEQLSDRISMVDEGNIDKMKRLISQLKNLCLTEMVGFGDISGTITQFRVAMFQLGTAIRSLNDNTAGTVDPDDNAALKTIKALAGCANDLNIISTMDIDGLRAKISGLGGAMMLYAMGAEEVAKANGGEIDPDDETVTAAVKLLQSISTQLVEAGGFALPDDMPDEESLGLFGSSLAALAGALIKFEEAGQGLGTGTENALKTLEFFRDLKAKLTNTGFFDNLNLVHMLGGAEDSSVDADELTQFGINIENLGYALANFAASTQVVDSETGELKPIDYSKATEALDSIAALSQKLPTIQIVSIGDWWQEKSQTLGDLAVDLEHLGAALFLFTENTTFTDANGEIQAIDFTNTIAFLESLVEGETQLAKIHLGGLPELWEGREMNFSDLGVQLESLGIGLNDFSKAIAGDGTDEHPGFDAKMVQPALDGLTPMITFLQGMNRDLPTIGSLTEIFSGHQYTFTDLGQQMSELSKGLAAFALATNGDGTPANPGFDPSSVKLTIEGLSPMIDGLERMSKELPRINPLVDFFAGHTYTFTDLGQQMSELSKGLAAFALATNGDGTPEHPGFDPGSVKLVFESFDPMIEQLKTLGNDLDRVGSLFEIFDGHKMTFTDLGTQLTDISKGMTAFALAINGDGTAEHPGFKPESMGLVFESFDPMIKKLETMESELGRVGGLHELIDGHATTFTDLGKQMEALGTGMQAFNLAVEGDEDHPGFKPSKMAPTFESFQPMIDGLTRLSEDLPEVGGFKDIIEGHETTFTDLGNQMKVLAEGMQAFQLAVDGDKDHPGFKPSKMTPTFESFQPMIDGLTMLSEKLPEVGGIRDELWGHEVTFSDLGLQLTTLATGLKEFNEAVNGDGKDNKGFKPATMAPIFESFDPMIEQLEILQQKLPEIGGIKDDIWGHEYTFSDLGEQLTTMATGLKAFSDAVNGDGKGNEGFKPSKMAPTFESFQPMIDKLTLMQEELDTVGGFKESLFGRSTTFTDLGEQMTALATGMTDFSKAVSGDGTAENPGFNSAIVDPTVEALGKMVDLLNGTMSKLPTIGGLANAWNTFWSGRKMTFADFGPEIKALGDGLGAFVNAVPSNIADDHRGVDYALDIVSALIKVMQTLNEADPSQMTDAWIGITTLSSFMDQLVEVSNGRNQSIAGRLGEFMEQLNGIFTTDSAADLEAMQKKVQIFKLIAEGLSALASVETMNTDWEQIGKLLTSSTATAILSGSQDVITEVENMIKNAYTSASDFTTLGTDWKQLGINIGLGVRDGIEESTWLSNGPITSVVGMMLALYAAAKEAIDSNSPSKKFMELGEYSGEGLELGLDKSQDGVSKSGADMAQAAVDAAMAEFMSLPEGTRKMMMAEWEKNPPIVPDGTTIGDGTEVVQKIEEQKAAAEEASNAWGNFMNFAQAAMAEHFSPESISGTNPLVRTFDIAEQKIEESKDKFEQNLEALKALPLTEKISRIFGLVTSDGSLKAIFDKFIKGNLVDTVTGWIGKGVANLTVGMGKAYTLLTSGIGGLREKALGLVSKVIAIPGNLKEKFESGLGVVSDWMKNNQGIVAFISGTAQSLFDSVQESGGDWQKALGLFVSDLITEPDNAKEVAKGTIFEGVLNWLTGKSDVVSQEINAAAQALQDSGGNWRTAMNSVIADLFQHPEFMTSWVDTLATTFGDFFDGETADKVLAWLNNAAVVADAASSATGGAFEKASDVIGIISRILAEGTDGELTISPVLDLTNIDAGIEAMNRRFGSSSVGLDLTGSAGRAGRIGDRGTNGTTNQNGTNISGILERLTSLGMQMQEMGESIRSMQIVLDTGVVAGAVTDQVDRNLGRKKFYNGRGN